MNKAQTGMNRILYLTQSKPPINSSTGLDPTSSPIPPSTPTIQLHDLHFCYPARPETSILRGLSLSIPRGSHVCIVGPSGCGKSTIIALIQRFYDLQTSKTPITDSDPHDSGEIRIYGRPIAEWDVHKLRSMMGLVSQDTMLYQGTIRENILLGIDERNLTPDELQARLETACQQANLHDFITSLPSSYETELGSRGVAVSGGQRQRIALARCLIRNPQILLLDEWTSALDAESETAVRAALAKIRREREGLTIVSISHQIEGMKDADSIIVVDQGFVVEQGGWKELMRTKGRLWRMLDRS
jgi:ATP-binding cassette subfamily B (MDR/TAP) protein 1